MIIIFEFKFVYDIEVFPKWFLFVAKQFGEDKWVIIENRKDMMRFWKTHNTPDWLGLSYNGHQYDDNVIRWYLNGGDPYTASKNIITGDNWRPPYQITKSFYFYSYDAFTRVVDKTMAYGVSLKTLEGYLGVPIDEDHVPFDLPRELTPEEKAVVIHYCKSDVINTERVIIAQNKLTGDLEGRIGLCEYANNPKLINLTKARAAIAVLQGD